jgi:hypothetical protein
VLLASSEENEEGTAHPEVTGYQPDMRTFVVSTRFAPWFILCLVVSMTVTASCGGDVVDGAGPGGAGGGSAGGGTPTSTSGHGGNGITATTGTGGGDGPGGAGGGGGATASGGGGAGGGAGPGVACGAMTCDAGDECLVCDPADPDPDEQCVPHFGGTCGTWGMFPPLRIGCEGPGDCATGETCALFEGSLGTYTTCEPSDDCPDPCANCFYRVCRTLADCPPCATSCAPYQAPAYPLSVCTF